LHDKQTVTEGEGRSLSGITHKATAVFVLSWTWKLLDQGHRQLAPPPQTTVIYFFVIYFVIIWKLPYTRLLSSPSLNPTPRA